MSTDTELRRRLDAVLHAVDPPPAPLDQIVQRGKRIRLRRAGAAVAVLALTLTGIIATGVLPGSPRSQPAPLPAPAASGGQVFASGTVNGHAWRLAVQDIADPGRACLPAVTIDGMDADPLRYVLFQEPSSGAAVTLGPADPGTGFAFLQMPEAPAGQQIKDLIVNGKSIRPVTVTACGTRYTLTGFSYPLTGKLQLAAMTVAGRRLPVYSAPAVNTAMHPSGENPQVDGLWNSFQHPASLTAAGPVASGTVAGQTWSIELTLGTQGDCYEVLAGDGNATDSGSSCGPVSTPGGPESIVAITQNVPATLGELTGYAVSVSPGTARLRAELSDGSTLTVTPRIVAGRKYAAFIVSDPRSLVRLTWLNAAGQVLASTRSLPPSGYTQFQP
jgi:hypothetical protein